MSAPESIERLYKRELGGGALLDIGVYPLSFIQVQLFISCCGNCHYLAAMPTMLNGNTSQYSGQSEVLLEQLHDQQHGHCALSRMRFQSDKQFRHWTALCPATVIR